MWKPAIQTFNDLNLTPTENIKVFLAEQTIKTREKNIVEI
jgi:hypothetical protein